MRVIDDARRFSLLVIHYLFEGRGLRVTSPATPIRRFQNRAKGKDAINLPRLTAFDPSYLKARRQSTAGFEGGLVRRPLGLVGGALGAPGEEFEAGGAAAPGAKAEGARRQDAKAHRATGAGALA